MTIQSQSRSALKTLILTGPAPDFLHIDSAVLGDPTPLQQLQFFTAVTLSTQLPGQLSTAIWQ